MHLNLEFCREEIGGTLPNLALPKLIVFNMRSYLSLCWLALGSLLCSAGGHAGSATLQVSCGWQRLFSISSRLLSPTVGITG